MSNAQRILTKPEAFYMGSEGDHWIIRCEPSKYIRQNIALFSDIIKSTMGIESVLEFGAGSGNDLLALRQLLGDSVFSGVEINRMACDKMRELFPGIELFNGSAVDYIVKKQYDFVLSKGFLVHIISDLLPEIYDKLYNASSKYICLVEYYNPVPLEINWRNNKGLMFKRDFCGEIMDRYQDLTLIDYGFVYHRDNNFPQDDFNWFLLKKKVQER